MKLKQEQSQMDAPIVDVCSVSRSDISVKQALVALLAALVRDTSDLM